MLASLLAAAVFAAKLALLRPEQIEEMRVRIEAALDECTDLLERVGERVEAVAEHPWHGPFVRYAHNYGAGQLHVRIEWLQGALLLIEDQEQALMSGEL
jgi:hypothetical protein